MIDPYEHHDRAVLTGLRVLTLVIVAGTAFLIHALLTAPGVTTSGKDRHPIASAQAKADATMKVRK